MKGGLKVIVTYYRIHFINGEVLNVGEAREDEEIADLIDRFYEALPEGVLQIGPEDMPQYFIPVDNILYISRIPEE